ncbi:LAQU0S09e02850g1_1 [Lachancea quebecensis]|uniref:Mitochondrial inner membrane protease ATP23 n=1 Tax=Lachancea quebecensis TaxID=1654605 RepID=A0A0P1KTM7_9SACH|nr:LAQU0S09e02850g1_1 [Lachancea quebecensis]
MGDVIPPNEEIKKPKPPLDEASVRGFNWWRRTFQYKTGLGLTAAEKDRYENDYQFVIQRDQCNKCYEYRDWLLKYSPTVIFMAQQIAKLNKKDTNALKFDESKIICDSCPEWRSGGFHPELGILLCQNRIRDKWHLEDTMAHEMVHYFDNLKWQVDWLNLKHHACSEIRASSLSGECRFMQEFSRRGLGFKVSGGHQECVRRRATLSVMGNPNCKDEKHAEKVVNEVWDSCFGDTRPFEEIYR